MWYCKNSKCTDRTSNGFCSLPFCTQEREMRYMIIPAIMLEKMREQEEKARQKNRRKR